MSKDKKNRVVIIGHAYYREQSLWRDRLKAMLITVAATTVVLLGLIQQTL
jgi:hypothetical protein